MKALWEGSWGKADLASAGVLIGLGVLILLAVPGIETSFVTDPVGPRFFPSLLAVLLIGLSLVLASRGVLALRREVGAAAGRGAVEPATETPPPADVPESGGEEVAGVTEVGAARRVLLLVLGMGVYVAVLPTVGYGLTSFLFFSGILWVAGERRPLRVVVQAAAVTAVLALLFGVLLGVELPGGFLPRLPSGG